MSWGFFVGMGHWVYVIYSGKLDRYYVGESEDPVERLRQHRDGLYKGSATSKATDWESMLEMPCADRSHARRLEGWIKSQKSRAVIRRLIEEEDYRNYQVERFRQEGVAAPIGIGASPARGAKASA